MKMKKSNFEIIKNNNKEILIDCSESLIDSQLEINFKNIENIFLEVPILKTLFSIKNTVIGIRERVFFKRFIIFLVDISNFSNDNKLEAQLIEIIDRIEEDEKIKLMSNLLKN